MLSKPVQSLCPADLQQLVERGLMESRELDYKELLELGTGDARKEFLADVSSFANAVGGVIIFGAAEGRDEHGKKTGKCAELVGMACPNREEFRSVLESVIRDGISPRLCGVTWAFVDGYREGPVLVLKVPKSWSGPHMVSYRGSSRFYSRSSVGKYPLDVQQIRSAFLQSEGIETRVRAFRDGYVGENCG